MTPPDSFSSTNPRTRKRIANLQLARNILSIDHTTLTQMGIVYGTQSDSGRVVMSLLDWERAKRAGAVEIATSENEIEGNLPAVKY